MSIEQAFTKFRENISLTDKHEKKLLATRKIIRGAIRVAFNEQHSRYFDSESIAVLSSGRPNLTSIKPRFMTQGSFAYQTINYPATPPEQQVDLDDGVYFPLSYVDSISDHDFQNKAKILRNIVFNIVNNLSNVNEWKCYRKSKCIRLIIDFDAHIDLPIYSIPDNQIPTITELMTASLSKLDRDFQFSAATNVLLATDTGWIESDPRVIHEWVKVCSDKYGRDFKYYSRYIKAWRDNQWDDSKLSSIMIMSALDSALSDNQYPNSNQIALNLSFVARYISYSLSDTGIYDPSDRNKRFDEDMPDKAIVVGALDRLANSLDKSMGENDTKILRAKFGKRFPVIGSIKPAVLAATPLISSSKAIPQSRKI